MGKLEAMSEDEVLVRQSPILQQVFAEHTKLALPGESIADTNISRMHEIERRYLPSAAAGVLTEDARIDEAGILNELGAYKLHLEQTYLNARLSPKGDKIRFRLRKTRKTDASGQTSERYAVVLKSKVGGSQNTRLETEITLDPARPEDVPQIEEFNKLWKGKVIQSLDRYCIDGYTFTAGGQTHECDIHIENRHAQEGDEGMVRIEVEFKSDAAELAVEANPALLPAWIGLDITDDKRFKSKNLFEKGVPKRYYKHRDALIRQLKGSK